MKKALIFIWYIISFLLLILGIFLFNDEILSRKELIITGSAMIGAGGISYLSLKICSAYSRKLAFGAAAVLAFFACFFLEYRQPLYVFFPDDPHLTIEAKDAPITLNWAYWAKTPADLHTNIYDWKGWRDIKPDRLNFSDNWKQDSGFMVCRGNCSITFPTGLHLHQPIFSFQSESHTVVYAGEHPYDVNPNIVTPVFISGTAISRQLIFAVLFTCLSGILCCIFSFPAALLKESSESHGQVRDWVLFPAAFLIPVLILLIICYLLRICPFGEKTFLISDMQCQYVDFLVHIRTLLREGRSLFYSFSKSLGDDYLSLAAYYLSNPLDWLIAFFPEDRIPEGVSLLVIIRYALCGLTSAIYFLKVFKSKGETLIFSTAYALTSLNFVIAEHTQLRNGALILPLVFLGIDRIIQHKSGWVYYLSLAAAMVLNYYSGFQICYFAVPYFFCRLYLSESRRKLHNSLRFILLSLLAAGSCAALLIPVALQLVGGMKTFDLSVFTLDRNFRVIELLGKLFNSAFDQEQTLTSGLPNIFCGVMAPFCTPLFLMNRGISKKEKLSVSVLLLVCFLTMWINALNLVVHGFNEPVWWPYRYSFAVSFLLLLPALRCLQNHEGNTAFHYGICTIIMILLLMVLNGQVFSWLDKSAVLLNLLLCLLFSGLFFISNSGSRAKTAVFLFAALDLFLNGWMILGNKTDYDRSETKASFNAFYEENKALVDEIKTKDRGFYRMEKTYFHDANDAFLLDYNGVSHFSSTLKYKIMQFLPAAGYRFYPTRFEYGEGSTVTMDSILGIRYLVTDQEKIGKPYNAVFSRGNKTVYSNPYSLPIGFMISGASDLNENILDINDHFKMQNIMFSALSGNPEPVFTETKVVRTEPGENEIIWILKCEHTGTLYAFFVSESEQLSSIEVNGKQIGNYFDGRGHPVLRLGSFVDGEEITVTLRSADPEEQLQLSKAQFFFENPFLLLAETGRLKSEALAITEHSDGRLEGNITVWNEGKLFFSIPDDKGWQLLVDGRKTELTPAFDMFLSANLPAGEHEIQLKYEPQGLPTGLIVSIISIFCASAGLLTERRYLIRTAAKKR